MQHLPLVATVYQTCKMYNIIMNEVNILEIVNSAGEMFELILDIIPQTSLKDCGTGHGFRSL